MSSSRWTEQLDLMIRARTSLIWIRSSEEARVESLLKQTASRLQRQLGAWDFIDGLQGILNAEGVGLPLFRSLNHCNTAMGWRLPTPSALRIP